MSATNGGLGTPMHRDDYGDDNSDFGDDGHDDHTDNGDVAITGKHYSQHQFWNYVDDYLSFIHTELFQELADPADRCNKVIWYDLFSYCSANVLIISLGSSGRCYKLTC